MNPTTSTQPYGALAGVLDILGARVASPDAAKKQAAAETARRQLNALKGLAKGTRSGLDGLVARAERDLWAGIGSAL